MRIGKITENALKRSVLKQIRTEYKGMDSAAVGADCAFSYDKNTFSAVYPLTAKVSDPGFYAVAKAVNSLACQGIAADHVNVSILLPADAEEKELKNIVSDAIQACRECDTVYAGGHTEVTDAVNRAVVTATAAGNDIKDKSLLTRKPAAGLELVITKWVALEGTAMLAKEKKSELSRKYPVPFIEEAEGFRKYISIRKDAEVALKAGAAAMHDISSGGVFAALWEMAERAGCGLEADLRKIPVRQESIEICEFCEVNPYQLLSGGALLIATPDGEEMVRRLRQENIVASVVGRLTEGNDRILLNEEERRFLELPQADEIHKALL